jgi:hypothetical protein
MVNSKKDSIKLDGHSFSGAAVRKYATSEAFISAAEKEWFENDANRKEKLANVWSLANTPAPSAVAEKKKP